MTRSTNIIGARKLLHSILGALATLGPRPGVTVGGAADADTFVAPTSLNARARSCGSAVVPTVAPTSMAAAFCAANDPAPDQTVSTSAPQSAAGSRLGARRAVYNFETSMQGWEAGVANDSVTWAAGPAFDGTYALRFDIDAYTSGNRVVQILGPETVPPGATVRMHLWMSAMTPVHFAGVFVIDGNGFRYTAQGLSAGELNSDTWNMLNVTAPADAAQTQAIGLDLNLDAPWCGSVWVDGVDWDAAPARDLSQSTDYLRPVIVSASVGLGPYGLVTPLLGYEAAMVHIDACGIPGPKLFDGLARMRVASGANTVRMWFLQSAGGTRDWSRYTLAVQQAKAHGLRIVATLVNQWGLCEPSVNGTKVQKDLTWFQTGYRESGDGYTDSFRDFAGKITKHFANEETIAFWQIGNELAAPSADGSCDAQAATAALRTFADDMVRVIRKSDVNHLISLGSVGLDECGMADDGWEYVHAGLVDITEVHDYSPANETVPDALHLRIMQSQGLGKPLFVGELGVCNNLQSNFLCDGNTTAETLANRARVVDAKIKSWFAEGAAGVSLWAYDYDANYSITAGDPIEEVMHEIALAQLES